MGQSQPLVRTAPTLSSMLGPSPFRFRRHINCFWITKIDQSIFELCECKINAQKTFLWSPPPSPGPPVNFFFTKVVSLAMLRNLYEISTSQLSLGMSVSTRRSRLASLLHHFQIGRTWATWANNTASVKQEKLTNCGTKAADVLANVFPANFNANPMNILVHLQLLWLHNACQFKEICYRLAVI